MKYEYININLGDARIVFSIPARAEDLRSMLDQMNDSLRHEIQNLFIQNAMMPPPLPVNNS